MKKLVATSSLLLLALTLLSLISVDLAPCSASETSGDNEPTLQEWFTQNGYAVNVTTDETGIEVFPSGYYKVTILAEIAAYAPMNNLSWYLTSSGQLNYILHGENVTGDAVFFMADETFGLCLGSPDGLFYTEPCRNQDNEDHVLVFANPNVAGFIIAWEDLWNLGDGDFQDFILAALTPINVDVYYCPRTLNLKSKGRWITAIIRLPKGYKAKDVDVSSIMLNGTVSADLKHCLVLDCRKLHLLIVKFDRKAVIELIKNSLETKNCRKLFTTVRLTVTGILGDGIPFQGTNTIRIIHFSRHKTCHSLHFFYSQQCRLGSRVCKIRKACGPLHL